VSLSSNVTGSGPIMEVAVGPSGVTGR